jgi:hypothetical protein
MFMSPYREPTDEEEVEHYYKNNPHPHAGVNPNQYPQPAGPAKPTKTQRAVQLVANATRGTVAVVSATAQGAHDASRMTGVDQWAYRVNAPHGKPRSQQAQERYQNVPGAVGQTSVMHPGNKLYVIEGRILAASGAPKQQQPQQQRRKINPGFGDDPGF